MLDLLFPGNCIFSNLHSCISLLRNYINNILSYIVKVHNCGKIETNWHRGETNLQSDKFTSVFAFYHRFRRTHVTKLHDRLWFIRSFLITSKSSVFQIDQICNFEGLVYHPFWLQLVWRYYVSHLNPFWLQLFFGVISVSLFNFQLYNTLFG